MLVEDFFLEYNFKNNVVFFCGEQVVDGFEIELVESKEQCGSVQLKVEKEFIIVENSDFGFEKIFYNKDGKGFYISGLKNKKVKSEFCRSGVASILSFGYVLPGLELYEKVKALEPRSILKINRKTKGESVVYKRINVKEKESGETIPKLKSLLEGKINSTEYKALLMSGGMDSRILGCCASGDYNSFTFKLNGFRPDEEDYSRITTYLREVTGVNELITLDSSNKNIIDSYLISTLDAYDHVHPGRWKFDYFIKNIRQKNSSANWSFITGQTADTIINLNLTGNDITSKLRRGSFYGGLYHQFAKIVIKMLAPVMRRSGHKYSSYFDSISPFMSGNKYYSGYIVNDIEFPGWDLDKFSLLAEIVGSDNRDVLYSQAEKIIEEVFKEYSYGEEHYAMLDVCLKTFIWGMDMRGLREAIHRYGFGSHFVFMHDDIISFLLQADKKYTSPFSEYKKILCDLERNCRDDIYKKDKKNFMGSDFSNFANSFENIVEKGSLGHYWCSLFKTKEFSDFVDYLRDDVGIPLRLGHASNDFMELPYKYKDRLASLYLWSRAAKC